METAWVSKTSQYSFFFTVPPPTEVTRSTVPLKSTCLQRFFFSVCTVLTHSLLVTSKEACLEVDIEQIE